MEDKNKIYYGDTQDYQKDLIDLIDLIDVMEEYAKQTKEEYGKQNTIEKQRQYVPDPNKYYPKNPYTGIPLPSAPLPAPPNPYPRSYEEFEQLTISVEKYMRNHEIISHHGLVLLEHAESESFDQHVDTLDKDGLVSLFQKIRQLLRLKFNE